MLRHRTHLGCDPNTSDLQHSRARFAKSTRSDAVLTTKRLVWSLLSASPLAFGLPVLIGVAVTISRVLRAGYPDSVGCINADATALYLGQAIYQNPAHGYTGCVYTPLLPAFISLLFHIRVWFGWPLLVTACACMSLVVLVARTAYSPIGAAPRISRLASAVGIGGVAYWSVSSLHLLLIDQSPDQVAWAFGLFGLVAVASFGPAPSTRRVVTSALLLSAALWTKQTTVALVFTVFVWIWTLVGLSALTRQAATVFTAALVGLNAAVLLAVNILTHGWEFYFNFEVGTHAAMFPGLARLAAIGGTASVVALGVACVIWIVIVGDAAIGLRMNLASCLANRALARRVHRVLVMEDWTGRCVLLLGCYAVIGFFFAIYCLRLQGSAENEFVGVTWALGLIAAVGWRWTQQRHRTSIVAGGCLAFCLVVGHDAAVRQIAARHSVIIPPYGTAQRWLEVPVELRLWALHHTLYLPEHPEIDVATGGPIYPNLAAMSEPLIAGDQPMYLVRALLNRRFDGVMPFTPAEEESPFMSGYGKSEENYLWKLDQVIAARYVAAPNLPRGVLERRPGPERAQWMRFCFGPFTAGGVTLRIRHGGGFWCSSTPGYLRLVATPAASSEVLTTRPVSVSGTIGIVFNSRASARVSVTLETADAKWVVRPAPGGGQISNFGIYSYAKGSLVGRTQVAAATRGDGHREIWLELRPSSGPLGAPHAAARDIAIAASPAARAPFVISATPRTSIDLRKMRF
jgi:hypothetical protein